MRLDKEKDRRSLISGPLLGFPVLLKPPGRWQYETAGIRSYKFVSLPDGSY